MRFIILLITILLPGVLGAEIFTPPPTDKSIDLLGHIFGTSIGSVNLGGSANPALQHMFEKFNAVVFTIGSMIVSYIGVISTINTAQEGQVMGRKWSSIWIPMRSVLGMLLIIPTPGSAYSMAQATIMWCIMNSIGVADNIWNGMLSDLSNGLSSTQAINRSNTDDARIQRVYNTLEQNGADLAESLLRSAVCLQTIHKIHKGTAIEPDGGFKTPVWQNSNIKTLGSQVQLYQIETKLKAGNTQQAEYSGGWRIGIPNNKEFSAICGEYNVSGIARSTDWDKSIPVTEKMLATKAIEIYQHKILALQLILQNFTPLANHITDEAAPPYEYPIEFAGYRNKAITTYREILKHMVKPQRVDNIQSIIREGKLNGWLAAGSFYFILNQTYPIDFFADIMVSPTTQFPSCDDKDTCSKYSSERKNILYEPLRDFMEYGPEISYMGTKLWSSKIYLQNDNHIINEDGLQLDQDKAQPTTKEEELDKFLKNMLSVLQQMMHAQSDDPIISQGNLGSQMMSMSERAFLDKPHSFRGEVGTLISDWPSNIKNAFVKALINEQAENEKNFVVGYIVYGTIWSIGAMLAIYVPMVPYMIFTVGVIGWLLLVIEAIVAAPILAISFMLPSNDELGKVVQGLMLLLNILLRPLLMLFGFILATRLYQAVIKLVNFGMMANFNTLNNSGSIFAWVAMLTLYAAFVVGISNKCFTLIYALPDKILRWMGSSPEHTDAGQELQNSKSAISQTTDIGNRLVSTAEERSFRLGAGKLDSNTPAKT